MLSVESSGAREPGAGDVVGAFRLEARLGEGSMGVVHRAVRDDGRVVALKLLRPELARDDVFRGRFEREARIAAEFRHPHLVPLLEAGEADGRMYLASGYVEGGSLADRLADGGPLPVAETVRVAQELGAALDALHERGVVHRDVKPSNVMLTDGGAVALTDFGLARGRASTVLTRPGQLLGTIGYAAPEVIRGHPAEPATDVYALGCTIYECVSGRPPFADRGLFEIGLAHLEDEPESPGTDAAFGRAVLLALVKEPEARPSSAGAYAAALAEAAP